MSGRSAPAAPAEETGAWRSAVYEGTVRHRRTVPVGHEFTYRTFMMYVDLDEVPALFRRQFGWSSEGPALGWFRRADYHGDRTVPLKAAVSNLVERETGHRPAGPIRMLTHARYFGYIFNPVTFYYCFDPAGERLEVVVAEITNTPWGDVHPYVLRVRREKGDGGGGADERQARFAFAKEFHISPFVPMNVDYDWRFTAPGDTLAVHMNNLTRDGSKFFDATLALRRREIEPGTLTKALARYPFHTAKVIFGIYWQALRLKLKGAPVYDHPRDTKTGEPETIR